MRQVFLIHAHEDIGQLNMLVSQLPDDDFLIDVNGLHPAAHLVLPNRRLEMELAALAGRELLDCVAVGPQGWACAERYQHFHPGGAPGARACRAANRMMCIMRIMRIIGLRRAMVNGWQPWGGSSWWSLLRQCVEAIVEQVRADPAIQRFFRTVSCADALFFQTLVTNSPLRDSVAADNYRHADWVGAGTGARHPKVLDERDFAAIHASRAHFCRKLEAPASAALLPLRRRRRDGGERGEP